MVLTPLELILNWSSYSRHANSEQLSGGTALVPNHHTREDSECKKLRRPRAHPFNSVEAMRAAAAVAAARRRWCAAKL